MNIRHLFFGLLCVVPILAAAEDQSMVYLDLDNRVPNSPPWPDLVIRIIKGNMAVVKWRLGDQYRELTPIKAAGDHMARTIKVNLGDSKQPVLYTISLKLSNDVATAHIQRDADQSVPRGFRVQAVVAGTGRVLSMGELAKVNAVNPAFDFPCWRGPFGGGTVHANSPQLVTDHTAARVMWVSDAKIGGIWGAGVHCNFDNPVVHAGVVLMNFALPSGDKRYTKGYGVGAVENDDLIDATDVVLALDAATGRPLWRHEDPKGMNLYTCRKRGPEHTGVAADGRFFAQGSTDRIFAFDIASGRLLWCKDDLNRNKEFEQARQRVYQTLDGGGRGFIDVITSPLVHADGVVAVSDSHTLVGLDAATGKELWQLPGLANRAPLAWRGADGIGIVAYDGNGLVCVDPRSGKRLWDVKLKSVDKPAVCGDRLVTKFLPDDAPKTSGDR